MKYTLLILAVSMLQGCYGNQVVARGNDSIASTRHSLRGPTDASRGLAENNPLQREIDEENEVREQAGLPLLEYSTVFQREETICRALRFVEGACTAGTYSDGSRRCNYIHPYFCVPAVPRPN